MRVLLYLSFSLSLLAQSPTIAWSQVSGSTGTTPTTNGYLKIVMDPVTNRMLVYAAEHNSIAIYSAAFFEYNIAGNSFLRITGTGSTSDMCPADTSTLPGDRHPVGQLAIDTMRNRYWLWGGVCEGTDRTDMYWMSLNSDPSTDALTQVSPVHFPGGDEGDMTYDSVDDCLLSYKGTVWRYCPAAGTPDWINDSVSGPLGVAFSRIVYVPGRAKAYKYGGCTGNTATCYTELYSYDPVGKTWTALCGAGCTPPLLDTQNGSSSMYAAMVYNSQRGTLMLHHFLGVNGVSPAPQDYEYNIDTDRWTILTTTGNGPNNTNGLTMAYDPNTNKLITWDVAGIWTGQITDPNGGGGASGNMTISGSVTVGK